MKAWRWYGFKDMRLDEVPMPEVRPGWVLTKVKVVQPSVTEIQLSMGIPTNSIEVITKLIEEKAPIRLFGHELCAEVIEVGEGVEGIKVGDRVTASTAIPCHKCQFCRAGMQRLCRSGSQLGRDVPGGFAEFTALPAEILTIVPDSLNDNEGTCIQPASSAVGAVRDSGIRLGDTVAIVGQGCMGNYAMQLSRTAARIIVVDVREEALALSAQLGADDIVDARKGDAVKRVLELTGGMGADIVFEAAGGSPEVGLAGHKTLLQAFDMVRQGGKVIEMAFHAASVPIDVDRLHRRGVDYVMPKGANIEGLRLTAKLAAAKRLQLAPLITHVVHGLERLPEAFELTLNKAKSKAMNPVQIVV